MKTKDEPSGWPFRPNRETAWVHYKTMLCNATILIVYPFDYDTGVTRDVLSNGLKKGRKANKENFQITTSSLSFVLLLPASVYSTTVFGFSAGEYIALGNYKEVIFVRAGNSSQSIELLLNKAIPALANMTVVLDSARIPLMPTSASNLYMFPLKTVPGCIQQPYSYSPPDCEPCSVSSF